MAHEVFISHSSRDKSIADAICARLEQNSLRCWIAPRDIIPGTTYSSSIIDAINNTTVMVIVLTTASNLSQHVFLEVERAVSKGVPVVPFRLENIPLGKDLEFFLSAGHWLDALTPPLEQHLDRLAVAVQSLLHLKRPETAPDSKADRKSLERKFKEIAPEEWDGRKTGFRRFIQNVFAEKL